jgi:hypothetical protein
MQSDVVISQVHRVLDAHSSVDESFDGLSIALSTLREVEVEHVHFPLRFTIQKGGTAMKHVLDSKGSIAMDMGQVTKRMTILE